MPTTLSRATICCMFVLSCGAQGAKFPWGSSAGHADAEHGSVRTLNDGYRRTRSQVLVREIDHPTRATLDYAAYHANFMIADPEPERPIEVTAPPNTAQPFAGVLEKGSLTSDVKKMALTDDERRNPLAFAPLSEFLQMQKVSGAAGIQQLGSAVRGETWGYPATPGSPYQSVSEVYLHTPKSGPPELWAKVEFQPWFKAFANSPDQDGDGFPEVYGRVRADLVTPAIALSIQRDYMGAEMAPAEVKKWANQLSSYWYPSFNTDLMAAGDQWPDQQTEPAIKGELGGHVFKSPSIVLRGKPQGKPTYEVFVVKTGATAGAAPAAGGSGVVKLPKSRPAPQTQAIIDGVTRELGTHPHSSWTDWAKEVAPLHDVLAQKLKASPATVKGLIGTNGFLYYRHDLEYAVGGDLEKQRKGKNPLPIIVAFKKKLEEHGVDFLFIPVPTKLDVYPDELDPAGKPFVGKVINPFARKFLLDLAHSGVEVVDLLPRFLAARAADATEKEPVYQKQDTHWTDRGLRMAAEIIAARVKQYGWYPGLAAHAQRMGIRETTFSRFGDLHSRIPEAQQGEIPGRSPRCAPGARTIGGPLR